MKKFIIQLIITTCTSCAVLFIISFFILESNLDHFYSLNSPKQTSLILGESRAKFGIVPKVLKNKINTDIFNFAFNFNYSPYGPIYYNAIDKKLNKKQNKGIFILSVHSGTISSINRPSNALEKPREATEILGKINIFNEIPKSYYFMFSFHELNLKYLLQNDLKRSYLDGWKTIDFSNTSLLKPESTQRHFNKMAKIDLYLSKIRITYLKKTIELLKNYGDVYLVRIPIHEVFFNYEENTFPQFNSIIDSIASGTAVKYLDFTDLNNKFNYRDGSHLTTESAILFTEILSDSINLYQKNILNTVVAKD